MFRNIVVGTDGSTTADRAVDVAAALARDWNATLHLVMAHRTVPALVPAGGGIGVPPTAADGQGVLERTRAERALDATVDRLGVRPPTCTHTVGGDAADSIVEVASRVGAELVVVGSRGMKGPRRLLGSVPNSVAHKAGCAVLIVKTD